MTDLIERQAAIEAVEKTMVDMLEDYLCYDVVTVLKSMPSAETKRKTGIWMGSVCSECGNSTSFYYDCDYCPNCGAKMEAGHE